MDANPAGTTTIAGDRLAPAELRTGDVIGDRYLVQELLGRGGMGSVFLVQDQLLEEAVALKLLDVAPSPSAVERFRDEVRLARRITHTNVARTHDLGTHNDRLFLTMELIVGRSLRDLIKAEAPLQAREAVELTITIADGLAAAHAAGVVHRDLKPENILLDEHGRAVLTDFGIAAALTADRTEAPSLQGTPLYMSPEQARAEPVDARSDVFSLGLILYELLSGQTAYPLASAVATVVARAEGPPRRVDAVAPVDAQLADVVHAFLAHAPDERPADAAISCDMLSPFLATESGEWPTPLGEAARRSSERARLAGRAAPPTIRGAPVVAVVPFSCPAGQQALESTTLTEDVLDALSCGRTVQVLAGGVAREFGWHSDPREIGVRLGADIIVQGRLAVRDGVLAFRANISDGRSGAQRLRVKVSLPDSDAESRRVLAGKIARRVRTELLTLVARRDTPAEAVDLYVQARALDGGFGFEDAAEAMGLLERSLELAPHFALARSAHATAMLRTWFLPADPGSSGLEARVREAVSRAVEADSEYPETQVAVARLAVQDGRWRAAAHALGRALDAMPSLVEAHAYLGLLQVEAGRTDEGLEHLRLAAAMDPGTTLYDYEVARQAALRGDLDLFDKTVATLASPDRGLDVMFLELRVAAWCQREDRLRELLRIAETMELPIFRTVVVHARAILGLCSVDETEAVVGALAANPDINPRFRTVGLQVLAETLTICGEPERGLDRLVEAVEGPLVDLVWLERCPALAPLRDTPGFVRPCSRSEAAARRSGESRAAPVDLFGRVLEVEFVLVREFAPDGADRQTGGRHRAVDSTGQGGVDRQTRVHER